jgi:hypothetical protein
VSLDNRAIYSFELMVEWLILHKDFSMEEAIEYIELDLSKQLETMGNKAPIILYLLER